MKRINFWAFFFVATLRNRKMFISSLGNSDEKRLRGLFSLPSCVHSVNCFLTCFGLHPRDELSNGE